MASPVKNFTDPTTLSRMVSFSLFSLPIPIIHMPSMLKCFGEPTPKSNGLFLVGKTLAPIVIAHTAQVPKPPLGKMLINTFPPIYRERVNVTGIADSPRIFPAIYLNHTTS